jgi:hypothetical protein
LLAGLAFFRRPKTLSAFASPRYCAPLVIWVTGFLPFVLDLIQPLKVMQSWDASRVDYQTKGLLYLVLCLGLFWVGFALPMRSKAASRVVNSFSMNFNPLRLRVIAILMVTATTVHLLFAQGSSLIDVRWGGEYVEEAWVMYVRLRLVFPLNVMALALYGLGWPGPEVRGRFITWVGAIYVLFLGSLPLCSTFSRGTGMVPLLMLFGYVVGRRRIPVLASVFAVGFLIYAGHVGLSGRGVYGHYAGVLPYMEHFVSGAKFEVANSGTTVKAGDALTPLCVCIDVRDRQAFVDQDTITQWFIFQVPVPHVFGFTGTFTLDLTWFVGGHGGWGYTPTMFGDTFVHLGWWGCLMFIFVGAAYRLLENLIFQEATGGGPSIFALAAQPTAYYALVLGCFNTYRSWVSNFTFGIGLIIVLLWALQKVAPGGHGDSDGLAESPAQDTGETALSV